MKKLALMSLVALAFAVGYALPRHAKAGSDEPIQAEKVAEVSTQGVWHFTHRGYSCYVVVGNGGGLSGISCPGR